MEQEQLVEFIKPYELKASQYEGVLGSKLAMDNAFMLLLQRHWLLESAVTHPWGSDGEYGRLAKESAADTMFGLAVISWANAHAPGNWLAKCHYQEQPRMAELYRHFWKRRDKYLGHAELYAVDFGAADSPYPLLYASEADDLWDLVRFARNLCLDEMQNSITVGSVFANPDGSFDFVERPLRESDLDPDDIDALGLAFSEKMMDEGFKAIRKRQAVTPSQTLNPTKTPPSAPEQP